MIIDNTRIMHKSLKLTEHVSKGEERDQDVRLVWTMRSQLEANGRDICHYVLMSEHDTLGVSILFYLIKN